MAGPRKSLTPAQLATPVGAELLQRVQKITRGGRLDAADAAPFLEWLTANQDAEIAAIDHLIQVVRVFVEEGDGAPEKVALLHDEIQRVLPANLRGAAQFKRKMAKAEDRARVARIRNDERDERRINQPVDRFEFEVAGTGHGDHEAAIRALDLANTTFPVHLTLEPGNPHGPDAIAVVVAGRHIGYVPRDRAEWLAEDLREGRYDARCKKVLVRRTHLTPVITGVLYDEAATEGRKALVTTFHGPIDGTPTSGDGSGLGCLSFVVIAIIIIGFSCIGNLVFHWF